jgi:phage protein D
MGDLGTAPLLYSARPSLKLDGARQQSLEGGLLSLVVEEDVDGMARCEASFGNWGTAAGTVGFVYFDRALLEFGKPLVVSIGGGDAAADVFEGRISGLEGRFPKSRPPEILILAEDRLQDLRMTRRSRMFEEASVEDAIRAIASDHGLTPQIDIEAPTLAVLAQVNQSDLAFLRQAAADVDAEVWMRGTDLFVQARARRPSETVTLTYGRGLQELRLTADLAHQCSKLVVGGWDVAAKEAIESEGGPSGLSGEAEGRTGSQVLEDAFGSRVERIVHRLPLTSAEGVALAGSAYRQRARRFVSGEAVAEGDGRIRVGSSVSFAGTGPLFDGAYTVVALRHVFDLERGLVTEFSVERPWIGPAGGAA